MYPSSSQPVQIRGGHGDDDVDIDVRPLQLQSDKPRSKEATQS
jgi:hypothetical protein